MSIKIKQMQSKGTGENIAPLTPEIAVYDTNGRRLNEKLLTLATKAELTAKADASALAEKADKTYVDTQLEGKASTSSVSEISTELTELSGAAVKVTEQTLTDSQKAQARANIGAAAEGGASTPSGDPMHYLFVTAGAVWNATSGYWELNGLTNITTEQMRNIFVYGRVECYFLQSVFLNKTIRTTIPTTSMNINNGPSINGSVAFYSSRVESVKLSLGNNGVELSNMSYMFYNCHSLKNIIDVLSFPSTTASYINNTFAYCSSLENVKIRRLKISISFADCKNISNESIAYIINNAQNTSNITITLHADAYARATADADIVSAAASHNITLAQA